MLEIKHPITGERLKVAENDFETEMDWNQAKRACNDLGNGWRLATMSELELMYRELHKKGKGNFKNSSYWSSKEYDVDCAYDLPFSEGINYGPTNKKCTVYVRAVRAF